ncbi:MAG: insulinase family protein [Solirubrobacterales bacterium]|nr:insulinase family protein [Solirubrobacterales bacterium]
MTDRPLPAGVELTELDSGLEVVTENVPSVRSVALGMWVRTGSRDETPAQAGVSHFLEHLLFKGTERHSAIEISELFDGMGAATNAATSKETTHLHARFLDEHTDEAFDLLAEMLLAPALPPDEIDSEREVVLEEIAMYEDEPQDRVHDVLAEAIYGDHPLGRRVLGRAEVIGSIPVPRIADYHHARYTADRIVVAAAGNVEHERIVELARRMLSPASGSGARPNGVPDAAAERFLFYPKETEQYHICFGGAGIARGDERRFALGVVDAVFGGSVSSRLFREVREKRGLAYSVGSYSEQFVDRGTVAMYVGTRADNVAECCEIIGRELARLHADGITEQELARAKEHIKGRMVLGLESTSARMSRNARAILFDVPLLSLDEMLERVEAVDLAQAADLAHALYDPAALAAACVGPDEERFKAAAGSVSPELAAA